MFFGFYNYLVHAIFAFSYLKTILTLIVHKKKEIQLFTQIDTKVSSDVIKIDNDIYLNHFISHFLALLLVLSLYLS